MTSNKDIRILVVDDNPKIRTLIVTILKSAEFSQITQADNGKSAWDILNSNRFDLVLTDWMMPEMNGIELLQKIRNSSNELKDMPVMMVTASDRPDDIVLAAKWKINGYIVKPFKVKTVLAKIDKVLNG
jgi:two-component system chemotaxis response regulator CheY